MDIACKRSKNFSKQELEVMVDEIIIRKRLLFGKLDSMITSENKKRAWAKVAQTVSAVADTGIVRDVNAVKKKVGGHQIYCKKEGNGEGKRVEKNRRREDDNPAGPTGGEIVGGDCRNVS
ncbi:unnamed protein product [Arctogadus glacialis]